VSVGDAIGWGTATVAVVIAVSLTTASVLALIEHRNQQRQLRQMKDDLLEALRALEIRSDGRPFDLLQSMISNSAPYLSRPGVVEGESGPIDLASLRHDIGSLATWELRSVDRDWYTMALAFVAAYDSGRRQAAS
jgi:hypothetical protein